MHYASLLQPYIVTGSLYLLLVPVDNVSELEQKQEELLSVWNQGYESSDCDEDSDGPQNQGEYYDEEADYDNEDYGAEQADKNDGEEDVDALIS